MPHYKPPDYIDNTNGNTLAHTLNRLIQESDQNELDIATGFFDPRVWEKLADSLSRLEQFRLLLGKAPELESQTEPQIDLRDYYRRQLQNDVEEMPYTSHYSQLIDQLIDFLARNSVQVRLYPSFLHAKAYLFPNYSIVGSSNFTVAGLHRKAELNMVNKVDMIADHMRRQWFNSFWQEAEPYKEQLIEELQNSKFGTKEYSPFQLFMKVLYEYFQDRLLPAEAADFGGISLAAFQQEGLQEAIRLLDRHRGVMIADAVGLGKTYIGMGILEQYLLRRRKRGYIPKGLVVCPAQLRDLVWGPKLDEYGIKATIKSMEELGRQDFEWSLYNHYDLVLVDESHNFRNPGTGRYQNLNKVICTGKANKYVVLLTATPINNSIWDLYHQVMLLTQGNDSYYRQYNIPRLSSYFKQVVDGSAELFNLLEETAVLRSRHDVKKRQEAGEQIILPGIGEVRFPQRRLQAIHYNLEKTYRGFYNEIAEQIENLTLVSYNVEQFKAGRDENQVNRNSALISILKMVFLKRLESSLTAFAVSVDRQYQFQRRFFSLLQQGRLLDAASHRKLLALEDEAEGVEGETAVHDLIALLPDVDPSQYNLTAIETQLKADLAILQTLRDWIEIISTEKDGKTRDAKLEELKTILAGPLKGQKVLLFTYYQDTARYLYHSLQADPAWQKAAAEPRMGLITGATQSREEIVRRFAPIANSPRDAEGARQRKQLQTEEIQLLISTDVLSEGQNLQDAGVLINYDLHWNPVRMIQRAGRIDRLGTAYQELFIYNCFPEEGLEALLRLVERLQDRITSIDRTIGLDASVLGEVIHPRSLQELKRIKANEKEVLDELERQSELISTDEMKLPLITYLQMIGEESMRQIPLGIHSGKKSAVPGIFFAFRAKERHFWRFYPTDGSPVVTDKKRIFQLLFCKPEEPRTVPQHHIFPLLDQATQEIVSELQTQQKSRQIRPQLTGLNKEFYQAINQMNLLNELSAGLREKVGQVLLHKSLHPLRNDPALKTIQATYKQTKKVSVLAEQLDAYFVDHDLYQETAEPTILEQITVQDLQLVCYAVLA